MRLEDVLARISIEEAPEGIADIEITGVHADSRKIKEGQLFCALVGLEADGHEYLRAAADRGARAALVERVDPALSLPQIRVKNSRKAMAEAAANFHQHPSERLILTGITGSNGKTTTSLMLQAIYQLAGLQNGLVGTISYQTGMEKLASKLTTPESYDLQAYFAAMSAHGYSDALMEVSSVGQMQYRNHASVYRMAAFINCEREHLDDHGGSMAQYFADKQQLITGLGKEAVAVLNFDNAYTRSLCDKTQAQVISFAHEAMADVHAENLDLRTGFAAFDCVVPKAIAGYRCRIPAGRCRLRLAVPGYASMMNALAAISLGLARGISLDLCCQGVESYQGVERRFEAIYEGSFRIFDDHFANKGNIELTLTTILGMDYERLHILYALRGKRGVTVNRENVLAYLPFLPKLRLASFIASLSQDTVGHSNEVTPAELAVFQEEMRKAKLAYDLSAELEPAIMTLLDRVQPGDIILFAGAQGIDDGARLALHALAERYPEEAEAILSPLKDRVCGWNTKAEG